MDVEQCGASASTSASASMPTPTPFCVIDRRQWPLCIVHLKRAADTLQEMDEFGDVMAKLMHDVRAAVRPEKFYIMLIVDGIVDSSMQIKFRAAGIISRLRADARACLNAIAIVASNTLARSIVQMVLLLQPLQTRHSIFGNSADAAEWLDQQREALEALEAEDGETETAASTSPSTSASETDDMV
jgi:hypothetical protein